MPGETKIPRFTVETKINDKAIVYLVVDGLTHEATRTKDGTLEVFADYRSADMRAKELETLRGLPPYSVKQNIITGTWEIVDNTGEVLENELGDRATFDSEFEALHSLHHIVTNEDVADLGKRLNGVEERLIDLIDVLFGSGVITPSSIISKDEN